MGIVSNLSHRFTALTALSAAVLLTAPMALLGYRDGPPPDMSGGFGDDTCYMCHNDNPLNEFAGSLSIEGVPSNYQPGETYTISIELARQDLEAAGFQLAARNEQGGQAGTWRTLNASTQMIDSGITDGLKFVQQTLGSSVFDSEAIWRVEWTAPESGKVTFFGAANAANNDASPLGDHIYTLEQSTQPE